MKTSRIKLNEKKGLVIFALFIFLSIHSITCNAGSMGSNHNHPAIKAGIVGKHAPFNELFFFFLKSKSLNKNKFYGSYNPRLRDC